MKIFLSCLLTLSATSLSAQQKPPVVTPIDTINLRGILYKSDGKPAAHLFISSKQKDLKYGRWPIFALTDSDGRFVLKGARPNDTLHIETVNHDKPLVYFNKGSRFMTITLPPE